jgi:hypothetical protein
MNTKQRITAIAFSTFAVGLLTGAFLFSHDIGPDASQTQAPQIPASMVTDETPAATDAEADREPTGLTIAMVKDSVEPLAEPEQPIESGPAEPLPAAEALARIDDLAAGWGRMQAELAELRARLVVIEQRAEPTPAEPAAAANQLRRPTTPKEERVALQRAGVAPDLADDIVWRRAQASLARLELRDEAIRDGWLNSDRYREEMRRIEEQRVSIRDEIGIEAYDRYLFETGQQNRVLVDSVIPGSAGEESGIQPGDIIETYGNQPVFDFGDLRSATSAGERGELVPVNIRRGDQQVELWLPRGPIGIGLDATRADPRG